MQKPLKKIQLAHVYNKATLLFFFSKKGDYGWAQCGLHASLMEEELHKAACEWGQESFPLGCVLQTAPHWAPTIHDFAGFRDFSPKWDRVL